MSRPATLTLTLGLALASSLTLAQARKAEAPRSAPLYYPGFHDDWERRSAEAVGLDAAES